MTKTPSNRGVLNLCRPTHPNLLQAAFSFLQCSPHNLRKHTQTFPRRALSVSRRVHRLRQPSLARATMSKSTTVGTTNDSSHQDPCISNPELPHWYFCYGSNMVREKLKSRGPPSLPPITFTEVYTACLTDWQLCFDLRGAPPQEPAMASIRPYQGDEVYGLVYRIGTPDCWKKLLLSEGVTEHQGQYDGYHVVTVEVQCVKAGNPSEAIKILARTLVTNPRFSLPMYLQDIVRPSQRYMQLLIHGAKEEQLPPNYVQRLEVAPVARRWQPSILLLLMNLTLPFTFLMRRRHLRYVRFLVYPLNELGIVLYAMHEKLAVHSKYSALLRNAGLWFCRTCLLLLYSLYILPSALTVIFDPRGRRIYKWFRTRPAPQLPDRPAQAPTPA